MKDPDGDDVEDDSSDVDELYDPNLSGNEARPIVPPSPLKVMVDTDGEVLQVRLYKYGSWKSPHEEGADEDDRKKCMKFPNGKYNVREDAYRVPLTDPNLEHLFASWSREQYELTDAAKMFVDYHLKTRQLGDIKLEERLKYLNDGLVPKPKDYEHCACHPPRAHQVVAYCSMVAAEYFALLMDMGTGKSKVAVDVICNRARRKRKKFLAENPDFFTKGVAEGKRIPKYLALIVAPKTVCFNWIDPDIGEFAKHATQDINVERLTGKVLGRSDQLIELIKDLDHSECGVVFRHDKNSPVECQLKKCKPMNSPVICAVINYEGMTDLADVLRLIPWDIMILDESIKIKSGKTRRSKAAKKIRASAQSAAILTGLPITKDTRDLFSQFDFLKPGLLGYTTLKSFEDRYCDKYGKLRPDMLPELQKTLSRNSFVVKAEQCLDLPPKQYQTLHIEMAPDQTDAYNSMLNQMVVDFEEMEKLDIKRLEKANPDAALHKMLDNFDAAEKSVVSEVEGSSMELDPEILAKERLGKFSLARVIVVQMMRLEQITSGFIKMADGSIRRFSSNPKIDALEEYFEQIDASAGKVIVWACFREDVRAIMEKFKDTMKPVKIQGGMKDDDVQNSIKKFQSDDECRLLVANPASGGQGLNLTAARHAIYFSQSWSLDHRDQSERRCWRLGQTGSVMYTDLVVPNSIDGIVAQRLRMKKDIAEMLTDKGKIITALRDQLSARLGS